MEGEANYHMISFVSHGGIVYQLDSRGEQPVHLGEVSDADQMVETSLTAAKEFMNRWVYEA